MLFFKKILIGKSLVYLGGAITALGGAGAFTVYQLDLFGKEPINSSIFFVSSINYWSTLSFLTNFQDYYVNYIIPNMPFSDLLRFLTAVSKLEASKIDNDDLIKFDLIQKAKKILQNNEQINLLKKIYKNDDDIKEDKEACLKYIIADKTRRFKAGNKEKCVVKKEWGDLTEGSELLTKFKASDIYILEKWRFGLGKIPPHCINYCPKWYLEKKD